MIEQLMTHVLQEMRKMGSTPQPPCPRGRIEELRRTVLQEFGQTLPEEYLRALSIVDGLAWCGVHLFSSDLSQWVRRACTVPYGFLEMNRCSRDFEPNCDYLIFADDGVANYTYCISARQYQVVLTVGLTLMATYDTFEELMMDAFKSAIPDWHYERKS